MLLAVEIILLIIGLFFAFQKDKVVADDSNLTVVLNAGVQQEDGYYIDGSYGYAGEYLVTQKMQLPMGVYRMEVRYSSNDSGEMYTGVRSANAYYNELQTNAVSLYKNGEIANCEFYLWNDVEDLEAYVYYGGSESLVIESVQIVHTSAMARMFVAAWLLLALLVNALVILRDYMADHTVPKDKLLVWFGIPALAIVASVPLFTNYMTVGADAIFHWLRIESLAQSITEGAIPARVESRWLFGHGYANSIFYCDTFLVIPALLRLLGCSVNMAYSIYVFLVNLATAIIAYISFKGCFKNRYIGMVGSMLYTLAPYRVYNIYNRNAVGEYTAMIFLPLLCYGFYLLFAEDIHKKEYRYYWLIPTLGFSGIIQSHVLSCEIAGIFTIILCVILIKRVFRKETFIQLVKVVVGTVLLNLWFLLPMLDMMMSGEYRYMNQTGVTIQERGVMPAHFFYTMQGAGSNSRFHELGMYDTEPFTVGAAVLFALVVFFVILHGRKKEDGLPYRKAAWVAFAMGCIGLVFSCVYFPWDWIQSWNVITGTLVPMIQFPTRLTMIPVIAMTFVGCVAAYWVLTREKKPMQKAFFGVLCGVCVMFSLYQTNDFLLNEDGIIRLYSGESMGHSATLGGEYLPRDKDVDYTYHDAVPSEGIAIQNYSKEGLDTITTLQVEAGNGEYWVELPMLYYKGYTAEDVVTGERFETISGDSGDVRVLLPAGYDGSLHVWYSGMGYWRVAEVISLLAAVGMIAVGYCAKKKASADSERKAA